MTTRVLRPTSPARRIHQEEVELDETTEVLSGDDFLAAAIAAHDPWQEPGVWRAPDGIVAQLLVDTDILLVDTDICLWQA